MKYDGSEQAAEERTSRLVAGAMHLLMGLFIIGSLISLFLGLSEAENAIQQINFLALSAVLGIFARIAQAAKHHEQNK